MLLVSSGVFCVAVWLVASGWRQPRPRLDDALRRLRRAPTLRPVDGGRVDGGRVDGGTADGLPLGFADVGRRAGGARVTAWTAGWEQPLHLIGRPVDVHVGMLTAALVAGLIVPSLLVALLQLAGVISIGWFVPALASLVAAAAAPTIVHADAMGRADGVRVDLRHQLGAFIDMVTMLLAGNTGYEGALDQAARAGDGLLFRQLRRRMREVGTTGRSLVEALSLVADEYGIVELEQVAATATLSANEGAPVARSLAAKCATLRNTLAADEEASARIRNDKVTPPLVGMALLFMALIIYPALYLN